MGYFFVDRILDIQEDPGLGGIFRGRGIKSVSRWDPFLRPEQGGKLELSPCFAGEALGQLAAWVAMSRGGYVRRPVAGLTAEVQVGRAAEPGDLILLEVELESLEEDVVQYNGKASVGGEMVLELHHAAGPMLPMEEFDDPKEVERQFHVLSREGNTLPEGGSPLSQKSKDWFRPAAPSSGAAEVHPVIDAIVERDESRILAATCVSRAAPYLVGHFPRNPVLPATLLLDGQVLLARLLASGPGRKSIRVSRLLNLKMRDFVRPGTRLLSEVRIREGSADRILMDLTARMENRLVSSGALELVPLEGSI